MSPWVMPTWHTSRWWWRARPARYLVADDYPIGMPAESVDVLVAAVEAAWGTIDVVRVVNPDRAGDAELLHHLARQFRSAATPRTAATQYDYIWRSPDVRQALPLVRGPTLILHIRDDLVVR